jgi:transposase
MLEHLESNNDGQITISLQDYRSLLEENRILKETIKKLEAKIKELEEAILFLKNGRNSKTSHTPSSQDIGSANQKSLRVKSGLKPGGQLGHTGKTLMQKVVADEQIHHSMNFCSYCGHPFTEEMGEIVEKRQEVVLPPIQAKYVEHVTYKQVCTCCKKQCQSKFPEHIKAPIQYGDDVKVLVGYLSAYQYLPYHRITQLLDTIFHIPISEGTIDNILADMCEKAKPAYDMIREKIAQSAVVGADETGASIQRKKGWFHTWQNEILTFIVASLNRGFVTSCTYFKEGFEKAVYVSDCWAAQLKTPAFKHQLCLVHLLRELNNFEEALGCKWCSSLKELFKTSIELKKTMTAEDYKHPPTAIYDIEQKFDSLLQQPPIHQNHKLQAFYKRIVKHREHVFPFLYDQFVPPDNNGSERAIRNVKVKSKISTHFRTLEGANRFAVIRSVMDTTIKNNQPIFQALCAVASL